MTKQIWILLLFPMIALGFGSGTIKKIDTIENNTGLDITIAPNTGKVIIPYLNSGDIVYNDSGVTGLPIGTIGQILQVSGLGFPEWVTVSSSSPTTTEGDLIIRGVSVDERLPIGTPNQILVSNGTTATWQDPTSSSASFTTVTKTANATLATTGEDNVVVDASGGGDFTLTLPTASGNNGLTYKITKSTEANTVTIDGNAGDTIGGELLVAMATIDDNIIIYSDGTNWQYASDGVLYHARYNSSAGQIVFNNTKTIMEMTTLVRDTHNTYNTSTGVYTTPIRGCYLINGVSQFANLDADNGEYLIGYIEINNVVLRSDIIKFQASSSQQRTITSSTTKCLNKGDEVTFRVFQNMGVDESTDTDPTTNQFVITRIR